LEVKFDVKVFFLEKYLFFQAKEEKKYFAEKYFFAEAKEEKNNSTGVYKYISIRIPLDYIFDCRIKKVYFVNLL